MTAASDRTAAKRPSYAETAKVERQGDREPVRDTLRRSVRTAAAGVGCLAEFLDRLRTDGVMVRERFSERTPRQVTGYSVALPAQSDPSGKPIYFGGGKLADLTLPKLLRRWPCWCPGPRGPSSSPLRNHPFDVWPPGHERKLRLKSLGLQDTGGRPCLASWTVAVSVGLLGEPLPCRLPRDSEGDRDTSHSYGTLRRVRPCSVLAGGAGSHRAEYVRNFA